MLQDRAKMGPEPSKMTPNCRGWVQEDPSCARWPQDAPKTGPRWAQLGTKSPNIDPRSAQEGMLLALGSPVGHGIASQTCKKSFKIPSYLATCYQRGAGGMGRSPLDIYIGVWGGGGEEGLCRQPYTYIFIYSLTIMYDMRGMCSM